MTSQRKYALRMQITNIEGALIRALGLTERRGFKVLGVSFADHRGERKALELTVESERDVNVLQRQLEKLHDVFEVIVTNTEAPVMVPVAAGG